MHTILLALALVVPADTSQRAPGLEHVGLGLVERMIACAETRSAEECETGGQWFQSCSINCGPVYGSCAITCTAFPKTYACCRCGINGGEPEAICTCKVGHGGPGEPENVDPPIWIGILRWLGVVPNE